MDQSLVSLKVTVGDDISWDSALRVSFGSKAASTPPFGNEQWPFFG